MQVDKHSLLNDFPEHHHTIRHLKMNDNHFANLFEQHEKLDKEIHQIEEADGPVADAYLESLKYTRVHLKDELFNMVRVTEGAI